ncbi:DEAD/DEAH box helicase [Bowmanella dokdonensis]|uniref:ATP-dependent RNA helicase RhlE n=1 Tax=Bowmanella dokdonensis TaxID=751969 RepID=A0A939DQA5_9ALTE|nr:DEAD/DEAH box helicase [Bowmanella dokdonensis]MBN7826703.1 DEAD/DEAH box helicase [Bowmanella dokdonensis]
MSFEQLGLSAELLRAVAEQGYSQPTPIQAQAIPLVLQGKDVLAGAQTGTGKTAGFTLPLLQLLQGRPVKPGVRPVRALVLTPTRELAAQVAESVETYGKNLPLRSAVIFGGVNINPQIAALRRGVDILVATPGRLLDHVNQKTLDLSQVEILVLDEADRMLDMGFIHDIRRVLKLLPAKRQNLLFSATFSDEIRRLADGLLNQPVSVEVARRNTASETVEQTIHPVDKSNKRQLLSYLIGSKNWRQVLVFTRTKHGANRLAQQLEKDGLTAAAIHGNKSQGARTRALADFKSGQVRVLVATDIAARGLDIDQLPHVVNYELPNVPEDYVHRIGRTGRAGNEGEAISLVSGDEKKLLRDIERLIKRELPKVTVEGFAPDPNAVDEPDDRPAARPSRRRMGEKPRPSQANEGSGQPRRRRRPNPKARQPGARAA